MFFPRILVRTAGTLFFIVTSHGLAGGEKLDLKRMTPVPAPDPIPVMDFFRPLLLQEPKLNSAGTHIAAIVTMGEDQHDLLVYDLKTKAAEVVNGLANQDIYNVHWLNDRKLVFELFAKKMYGVGLYAADVGQIARAYPLFQYYGSTLIGIPKVNPLRPVVWNRYDSLDGGLRRDLGVCEANSELNAGGMVDLFMAGASASNAADARETNNKHIAHSFPPPGPGVVVRYLVDQEGQLAFGVTSSGGTLALQRFTHGIWNNCPVDLDQIDILGCGGPAGQLVVVGPRQEGKPRALQLMDAVTGKLGDVLLQDQEYDFNGWLYRHPTTHEILGATFARNGPRFIWLNDQYRRFQNLLDSRFPGLVVRILCSDEAQKLFLVATFSDRQPVAYHWVDLEKKSAGLFRNSAPWIDPARMQPENIIKFTTRDGHQLDAYLTLPAGASKQNPPPLVVLPHGGPWVRDNWGFDGEAQFLASRGYAVLKPNYRGSTGYGWMFAEEDQFDFRKMQNDVTDATRAAIATGWIDGTRIAIMGGSFGGYLAVSGVVNEPSLYRCAITNAGVFDWAELIREKNDYRSDGSASEWLKRKLGEPKKQQEKFEAISPLHHVEQIRVPVFVAGGKDDQNVEITQSKRLISALKKNHVPYETFLVSEEGHGMKHLNNQVELYSRIEAFLGRYLKPAVPVAMDR